VLSEPVDGCHMSGLHAGMPEVLTFVDICAGDLWLPLVDGSLFVQ
jgi:hypothetical protein